MWTQREPNADVALAVKNAEFETLFTERVIVPLVVLVKKFVQGGMCR